MFLQGEGRYFEVDGYTWVESHDTTLACAYHCEVLIVVMFEESLSKV